MRVSNFSLMIPEGVERESGYVNLDHGRQYTIRLMNHHNRQCDAEVWVDGKEVGTFRLPAYGSATLERKPDDSGRFTFFADVSAEAEQAGILTIPEENRGLVQVRFTPEREREYIRTSAFRGGAGGQSVTRSANLSSLSAEEKTSGGITGLTGHSDQQFRTVGPIDRDEANAVTISIRLVYDPSVKAVRVLTPLGQGNAVPPPVR